MVWLIDAPPAIPVPQLDIPNYQRPVQRIFTVYSYRFAFLWLIATVFVGGWIIIVVVWTMVRRRCPGCHWRWKSAASDYVPRGGWRLLLCNSPFSLASSTQTIEFCNHTSTSTVGPASIVHNVCIIKGGMTHTPQQVCASNCFPLPLSGSVYFCNNIRVDLKRDVNA